MELQAKTALNSKIKKAFKTLFFIAKIACSACFLYQTATWGLTFAVKLIC